MKTITKTQTLLSSTENGLFKNRLTYISISQLNNKDNSVPVILPILVRKF